MSNPIPCFVINLEKDTQRRSAMQTRLAKLGITPTFFKAVDGRLMSPEALESHVNRIRAQQEYGSLSAAEIGTSLSHIGIYQKMVNNQMPYAVVLEDDVCLDENFATYLDSHGPGSLAAHFAPTQAAMVQLTHKRAANVSAPEPWAKPGIRQCEPAVACGWPAATSLPWPPLKNWPNTSTRYGRWPTTGTALKKKGWCRYGRCSAILSGKPKKRRTQTLVPPENRA
jgi:hypothetical protein